MWGAVIPELLKGFLEKVSTDGLQVVTEQIAQPEELFGFQVLFAFEQQPARLLQHRHAALACHAARFSGADFVKRLVHFRHDVKTIEDVKRLGAFLANDVQMASSPFESEWRGANNAEENTVEQQEGA